MKLGRAEEHFSTIKGDLMAWKQTQPYTVSRTSDPEGGRHALIVEIKGQPPLDRLSVVTGDCVHNLRSALDNVVYAVAVEESGADPPPGFTDLQFPIADTGVKFAKQSRRIARLSAKAQSRIVAAQPYNRPHAELPPLLRLLADFDNADKHRLLNVVIANVAGGRFSFTTPSDQAIFIPPHVGFHFGPIKSGAEFARFTLHPPKRDIDYRYQADFVISIAHAAGPNGRTSSELGYVLEVMIAEVKRIVESMIL